MTGRFRLLQVCNVGRITGGTGACAWTVTRALPDWKHTVLFFSRPDTETRTGFGQSDINFDEMLTQRRLQTIQPDLILFHNTSARRIEEGLLLPPSLYYCHSKVTPIQCEQIICCSDYLRSCCDESLAATVLYQAVSRPPRLDGCGESRRLRSSLVVGRICTPSSRKWPSELIPFYRELSDRHPDVRWEFVGCPAELQAKLSEAVRGRATFLPASFAVRSRYWNWDVLLYHHPTLTETFGRTVAEAMRAECVPVVDNRGGFREQIAAGTGFLCRDVTEFWEALSRLEDPGERHRRARHCRAHADEHFSLERFRKRLLETFRLTACR